MEALSWDDDGALATHSPSTYKIPTAREWPTRFAVDFHGRPNREQTIHRSKAVGRAAVHARAVGVPRASATRSPASATAAVPRGSTRRRRPRRSCAPSARSTTARRCPGARPGDRGCGWRYAVRGARRRTRGRPARRRLVCGGHGPRLDAARARRGDGRDRRRRDRHHRRRQARVRGDPHRARRRSPRAPARRDVRFPLAASLGQCCGGVATLAFATVGADDRAWVAAVDATLRRGRRRRAGPRPRRRGRAPDGRHGDDGRGQPRRRRAGRGGDRAGARAARAADAGSAPAAVDAPQTSRSSCTCPAPPRFDVLLFGNGHVGRALVAGARRAAGAGALDRRARGATSRPRPPATSRSSRPTRPEAELARCRRPALPSSSLTHSHALDFDIVEAALARDDWRYLGLIGSRVEARAVRAPARRARPAAGRGRARQSARSAPTAGLPRGKEPGVIAVAVAAELPASCGATRAARAPPAGATVRYALRRMIAARIVRRADRCRAAAALVGHHQDLSRRSSPTTASTSTCCPARSTRCWARTAPASRR